MKQTLRLRPWLFLLPLASCLLPAALSAAGVGVVAVVGDSPISSLDVTERAELIIATTGLADNPEARKKILPQILKQLIDEELQKQSAKSKNIKVSEDEINNAIAGIEAQNQRPAGSLKKYLKGKGVPIQAFLGQVRAQIVWQKIMAQVIRPKVRISDSELQRASLNRRFMATSEEANITPLVLPVDKPEMEAQIKTLAEKLVADVRAGANLEEVARQFTKAPPGSEPNFWVPLEQMEPALMKAVKNGPKTGLLDPIRTRRGYQIIRINDRRTNGAVNMEDPTQVVMKEVLFGLPQDATPQQVDLTLQIAGQVAINPGSCLDEGVAGITDFKDTDIKVKFLRAALSDLPEYVRNQALTLDVGEIGEPFATPSGIRFYILCERVEMPQIAKADEKLRELLFREKLELEASKFMRNLRRESYVELR
jgi:peptidyl-prolyl cis-trans isomerase SurA